MSSTFYFVLPVNRTDLTISFAKELQLYIKDRIRPLLACRWVPSDEFSGTMLAAAMSIPTITEASRSGGYSFSFELTPGRVRTINVSFDCHIDLRDELPQHKVLVSINYNPEGVLLLKKIFEDVKGFFFVAETEEVQPNPGKLFSITFKRKRGEKIAEFDSVVDFFKEEVFFEKVGIPKYKWKEVSAFYSCNLGEAHIYSVVSGEVLVNAKFDANAAQKVDHSQLHPCKPDWATHVAINKGAPEKRYYVVLQGAKLATGYEFGAGEFSHELKADEWDVVAI